MQDQSTLSVTLRTEFTRKELLKRMSRNFPDTKQLRAFLRDPAVRLSLNACESIGGRPNRCHDNAEDGCDWLRVLGYDTRIALGFMVDHEYWRISVIEHAWLVVTDDIGEEHIVDPTLPFLSARRWPTYFEGAVDDPARPYPDLRNRAYKAAFQEAKHLAETCEYPFMETAPRRIHIGRMNWVEGLDAAEGRVSR